MKALKQRFCTILCLFLVFFPALACSESHRIVDPTQIAPQDLSGKDLSFKNMYNDDFSGKDLSNASFELSFIKGSNFSNANLQGANLKDAQGQGANFTGADLRGANLTRFCFKDAVFENAKLDPRWEEIISLFTINFRSKQDLSNLDLSGVCLRGYVLDGAKMQGTNLTEADLADTSFIGSNLQEVNLTKATVGGANFTDANLTGATVPEDQFVGVTLCRATLPDGSVSNRDCPKDTLTSTSVSDNINLAQLSSGEYIVYRTYGRNNNEEVHYLKVLNLDGSYVGILTYIDPSSTPSVSSGNHFIAYSEYRRLNLINISNMERTTLYESSLDKDPCIFDFSKPSWSPDEDHIAISCGSYIGLFSVSGAKLLGTILSPIQKEEGERQKIDQVVWSPNGKWISYIVRRTGLPEGKIEGPFVATVNCIQSSGVCANESRLITQQPGALSWSPSNLLAIAPFDTSDGIVPVFDIESQAKVFEIIAPLKTRVENVFWSQSSNWVLATQYGFDSFNVEMNIVFINPINSEEGKQVISADDTFLDPVFLLQIP